jgi:hypothetical protein
MFRQGIKECGPGKKVQRDKEKSPNRDNIISPYNLNGAMDYYYLWPGIGFILGCS